MNNQAALNQMTAQQVRTWDVPDMRTLAAMRSVPRERFVPPAWRSLACADCALPLAHGKHMLTPMMAGRILQSVAVRGGDQVLEVGTGSGYLSACMALMGGQVQSLELHADLAATARANLQAADCSSVEVSCADGLGLVSETAYDVIVLTGSLPLYQQCFERALKFGGRLFVVVGSGAVMQARLVRRLGPAEFTSSVLFETSLEALEHAPAPPAFEF
ncbi:MAG: protein-L-isoaspartate O-methyltransferase [Steroidobacteraceae bacterium]